MLGCATYKGQHYCQSDAYTGRLSVMMQSQGHTACHRCWWSVSLDHICHYVAVAYLKQAQGGLGVAECHNEHIEHASSSLGRANEVLTTAIPRWDTGT